MITLLASFGLGLIPVALIGIMIAFQLDGPARRRVLRHPIAEARARLAGDAHDDVAGDEPRSPSSVS